MDDGNTVVELTERCPQCGTTFVSGYLQGRLRSVTLDCPACGRDLDPGRKIRSRSGTRGDPNRRPVASR
ncbi:MAG TPA: hypothetical protein VKG23_06270 [Thermoanaerobaculia bacterium]|nr:hypothetical protein [Thermoanaerobaculia bacterium]